MIHRLAAWLWIFSVLGVLLTAILVPFVYFLKPSPFRYYRFVRDTWNVRVRDKYFRWMPHYLYAVGMSVFIGQAVMTTLHYPLLSIMDASITQIGILDALAGFLSAAIDVMLRSGPWGRLSRSNAFIFAAFLNVIGYTGIMGFIMPILLGFGREWFWAQMVAVFVSSTFAGLNLSFQEYAVMRNDWNEDIVVAMSEERRQSSSDRQLSMRESYGLRLAHFTVVCRYPATIVANLIFGEYVNDKNEICSSYAFLGLLSAIHGIVLAWCWKNHTPRSQSEPQSPQSPQPSQKPRFETPSPKSVNHSNKAWTDAMPGGPYFRMAFGISTYNSVLEVTRKGYVRLLNLCVLHTEQIHDDSLSLLLTITFSVSWAFFWLADTARSNKVSDFAHYVKKYEVDLTGKMFVGMVSFLLMGLGHLFMGLTVMGFAGNQPRTGLLVSAVFFGLGQATSTGLRTVIKDDMRTLLRIHGHTEGYRRGMLRMVSSVATAVQILSSLLIASFGHRSDLASLFYACVTFFGVLMALMDSTNVRNFSRGDGSFRSDSEDKKMQALLQ